ncbi:hypothetical protein NDU88_000839 [Pleurodeles waltl]|uniref:Homeobox domain-containing protein n=2 Tax=Pleurodeles waltl TaxID=8319 RepID=A0AAV7P4X3_PLEWA|nr:hypothetical protein NDU88_000839 [Pleurodeles waltl]
MNTHLTVDGYQPYPLRASTPLSSWAEGPPYPPGPEKGDSALEVQPYASSVPETPLYSPPDSATSPEVEAPAQWALDEAKSPKKKAKTRTCFTQEQLAALNHRFLAQQYLSPLQTREMAASLGLTCKQVKTWFQNRRMKFKRCQKDTVWMDKTHWLSQGGSWPGGGTDIPQLLPQGYPAHQPSGTVQRVASHPYQNYAGVPYPHQMLPEDRAARQQGESLQQSQVYQPAMDMYQNYSAMEYPSTWKGDGYNYASAPHYPFGNPYNYCQQKQLPYNHQLRRPNIKS